MKTQILITLNTMNDLIKIAWRNLWRNKRRTLITASSIFFAVFFAIIMRSFQLGTYGHMIEQSIESYTGYLQVQNPEYFDDPSIDNSFEIPYKTVEKIRNHKNIKAIAPRIESFALASSGIQSKGVLISGIDPVDEASVSNPGHRLVKLHFSEEALNRIQNDQALPETVIEKMTIFRNSFYATEAKIALDLGFDKEESENYLPVIRNYCRFESEFLSSGNNGVVIGNRLAKYLNVTVGDTVILIGQGFQGSSASGIYPVRGIVQLTSPDLDNKLIYMNIGEVKKFLGLDDHITSLAINLNNIDEITTTQKELQQLIAHDNLTVKNWKEIIPTLKQQIEGDNISGIVFIGILYIIVFFGIFGTVVMMVAERRREFGVMIAIGMKQVKLSRIVTIEMLFLGLMGIVSGMIVTIPILLYGHYNPFRLTGDVARMYEDMGFDPTMPLALFDSYFFIQGVVVLTMILLACLTPLRSIKNLNVIKAIRG